VSQKQTMRWKARALDCAALAFWAGLAGRSLWILIHAASLQQVGLFVFNLLAALLCAIRRPATASGPGAVGAWLTMLLPLVSLQPPAPGTIADPPVLAVQAVGLAGMLLALLALGRSFGIAPARRELVTRGAYRVVRHPLYASEIVAIGGYVAGAASAWNVTALAVFIVGQISRVCLEEKLLSGDLEYQAYCGQVVWRLMPGVW